MYSKDEATEKILHYLNDSAEFSCEEKQIWSDIVSELLNYQDETLKRIGSKSVKTDKNNMNIISGITRIISKNDGKLSDDLYYMSEADDIEKKYFQIDSIYSKKHERKDGEWFIIGTGYLDCDYEEVCSLCGRDKTYIGICSEGEFEYSLVLKNTLLQREKKLYKIAEYYDVEEPLIFAPMLRRWVYIETKSSVNASSQNLQLEKNGLSCLLVGWKSVWNVDFVDKFDRIKTFKGYKYVINEQKEYMYILPEEGYQNQLFIKQDYDSDRNENYFLVSSDTITNADDYVFQVRIPKTKLEDKNNDKYKLYSNFGNNDNEIMRIYSKSDIFSFLKGYSKFLKCIGVYTQYPNDLKIFEYEYGFEYPAFSEYLSFSKRPVIYVVFENNGEKFLFDRIVYVIHILQRKFPEYIWKGGVFQ